MDKVQRFINNSHKLYNDEIPYQFKYIPKYIIRKYIRSNPHKYSEIRFIYQYYYNNERIHEYYQKVMNDDNSLIYLGHYYLFRNNYNVEEYIKWAIELGNSNAMCVLGQYYQNIGKNCDLMKKYYIQAIELGNSNAMYSLGRYYHYIAYNYELMQYYDLCAIKLNHRYGIEVYSRYSRYIRFV